MNEVLSHAWMSQKIPSQEEVASELDAKKQAYNAAMEGQQEAKAQKKEEREKKRRERACAAVRGEDNAEMKVSEEEIAQ